MLPINVQHLSRPTDVNAKAQLVEVRKAAGRNAEPPTSPRGRAEQSEMIASVGADTLVAELGAGVSSSGNGRYLDLNPRNSDGVTSWDGSPQSNAEHWARESAHDARGSQEKVLVAAGKTNAPFVSTLHKDSVVAIQPSAPPKSPVRTVLPLRSHNSYLSDTKVDAADTWGRPRAIETESDPTTFDFATEDPHTHKMNLSKMQLQLPNVSDEQSNIEDAAYQGYIIRTKNNNEWASTTPVETLKAERAEILRATLLAQLIRPEASHNFRHYLVGEGRPIQKEVATDFLADEKVANQYREALESQAIEYALRNPDAKEFTVQGPLFNEEVMNGEELTLANKDRFLAYGHNWGGGVGHYKVVKRESGGVELEGATRLFMHDRYNFSPYGIDVPVLDIPRQHVFEMSIADDPETNKPLAQNYDIFLVDEAVESRIRSGSS
jgi:hypothetical protein